MSCHVSALQAVYTNWSKLDARVFRRTSPEAIEALTIAAGSMGPKMEATCDFVRQTGGISAIGPLEEALPRYTGTTVAANVNGIEWFEKSTQEE